jgi:hypothetical protein
MLTRDAAGGALPDARVVSREVDEAVAAALGGAIDLSSAGGLH